MKQRSTTRFALAAALGLALAGCPFEVLDTGRDFPKMDCRPDCEGRCDGAEDGCGGVCTVDRCDGCCTRQHWCIPPSSSICDPREDHRWVVWSCEGRSVTQETCPEICLSEGKDVIVGVCGEGDCTCADSGDLECVDDHWVCLGDALAGVCDPESGWWEAVECADVCHEDGYSRSVGCEEQEDGTAICMCS